MSQTSSSPPGSQKVTGNPRCLAVWENEASLSLIEHIAYSYLISTIQKVLSVPPPRPPTEVMTQFDQNSRTAAAVMTGCNDNDGSCFSTIYQTIKCGMCVYTATNQVSSAPHGEACSSLEDRNITWTWDAAANTEVLTPVGRKIKIWSKLTNTSSP